MNIACLVIHEVVAKNEQLRKSSQLLSFSGEERLPFNDDLVQDPSLMIKSLADAAQPEPVCNRTSTSRLLSFSFTTNK